MLCGSVRSLQELEQEEQLCVQFSLICIITSVCGIFPDADSASYCNANRMQIQGILSCKGEASAACQGLPQAFKIMVEFYNFFIAFQVFIDIIEKERLF